MLVREGEVRKVLSLFCLPGQYALDTETTGLKSYLGDKLFSVILTNEIDSYYFNFQHYDDIDSDLILDRKNLALFEEILSVKLSLWFMHNAKFDMSMLANEGLFVDGQIHCTEAIGRLVNNTHMSYQLDKRAPDCGEKKSKAVDEHIAKNKLYHWEEIPGKKKRTKVPHFIDVPFEIISGYGCTDGDITRKLGLWQIARLEEIEKKQISVGIPSIMELYANERKVTKTCFKMERHGAAIDYDYTTRALAFETNIFKTCEKKFTKISSIPFKDSNKTLAQAFGAVGEKYPTTEKGNPSFRDEVLENFTTPMAQVVRDYRSSYKKANTYYRNFLDYSDTNGLIHANIRQGGTAPGRFSYSNPNLQNLNKKFDPEKEFLVRRSFVPGDPDYCFIMIDYDQMEYRLMLDYAGEMKIIRKILDEGLDVHTSTAELLKIVREFAKTINFLLIYGGGAVILAGKLGISVAEAKRLKQHYFDTLPKISDFISKVMNKAKYRKEIFNWFGRIYYFPDSNFAYKAPNYLIQGGCADIVKIAMNRIDDLLESKKARSKMLIQIHDEILFRFHKNEFEEIEPIKKIMETVYNYKHLPLTCGVDHSWKSWADKVKGLPQ